MSKKMNNLQSFIQKQTGAWAAKEWANTGAISSTYNVTPQNLKNLKKVFLTNAEIAMEPSKAVKEYKEELAAVTEQNTQLTQIVSKMTVEKEWLEKS